MHDHEEWDDLIYIPTRMRKVSSGIVWNILHCEWKFYQRINCHMWIYHLCCCLCDKLCIALFIFKPGLTYTDCFPYQKFLTFPEIFIKSFTVNKYSILGSTSYPVTKLITGSLVDHDSLEELRSSITIGCGMKCYV